MKKIDKVNFPTNNNKINCLITELNNTLDLYYDDIFEDETKSSKKIDLIK